MYATDGEKALTEVIGRPLTHALHLMCDIHMKDNIPSKLAELEIPSGAAEEYGMEFLAKHGK